jgi:hypothetical protein
MQFNPLDHPVALLEPALVTQQSAWAEHLPLAFVLIDLLRPRVAVELGVHFGDSYCAFCQAVSHLKLSTKMFGVDTWQGDKHAGSYGDEVLPLLRAHHDPRYSSFSKLMPMEFDAALDSFAPESIDLLHIDGLHTYEAVRHDFKTWLPKMSRRGVMLFHDTLDRSGDFGVHKLWAELIELYPGFEFRHGPGLGVLAVGPEVPTPLQSILSATAEQRDAIRAFYARLGREISIRRFSSQIIRGLFAAQSVINEWKDSTGQPVPAELRDIRVAMNHSLSFAQMHEEDVRQVVRSELNLRALKKSEHPTTQ